MLPVVLDSPQLYDLARFGRPAGIVLTENRPVSPALPYIVDTGRRRWTKVALRVRVEVGPGRRVRGFAHVNAVTDGKVSASVELEGRPNGRIRWTAVWLHGGRRGTTRGRTVRVGFTNYVRTQAATPGRHTLRFQVQRFDGFRVRRVVVEPASGLLVTRQPPQALVGRAEARPKRPAAGDVLRIDLRIRNIGVVAARHVRLRALASPGLRLPEPLPTVGPIAPGAVRRVKLEAQATTEGHQLLQLLTESEVGQDLQELELDVGPPAAASGGLTDGDGIQPGRWLALLGGLGAIGLLAARRRRARLR